MYVSSRRSSSFQIDVNQSPTIPLPPLAALAGHVTLHNGNAKLMSLPAGSVTITPSDVKIDLNNADPGADYYIGIRYSTKNLVGSTWPFGASTTVSDVFQTTTSAGGLVSKSTVSLPIQSSSAGFAAAKSSALSLARGAPGAGALARAHHASHRLSRSAVTPFATSGDRFPRRG